MGNFDAPLLPSKLRPPRARADTVARPRLVERLRSGVNAPLVLVAAPAGSGKTTLVVHALRELGLPFAWLSIDEADNDPVRFTRHLLAAACQVMPALAEADLEGVGLEALVEEILVAADELSAPSVLVLDDYHLIEQPSIHAQLGALVEAAPHQLSMVLATREDPPWALPRLRARGQLAEIRLVDLRFLADEADQFLRSTMALDIAPADRAALLDRTEGWAAGLQLAGLSLRGRDDQSATIARLTGRHGFVLDYLAGEVLERQPAEIQAALLRTSILDRLSGPLVEAVLDSKDGAALLQRLERANLFLVPLDEERTWYRYHVLFADLLRSRLLATLPDEVAGLHARASAWFGEHAPTAADGLWFVDQARRHALGAGDVTRAADLVASASARLLAENEEVTLLRWLDSLPEPVVRERLDLAVTGTWAFGLTGQSARRDARLADAEHALEHGQPDGWAYDAADLRGNVATLRAWVAGDRGDLDTAITEYQQALVHFPAIESAGRVAAHLHLGSVLLEADRLDEAERQLRESVERGLGGTNRHAALAALGYLGDLYLARGQLSAASALFQQAVDAGAVPGRRPLAAVSAAELGLGHVAYQRDDLATAETHWVQSRQISDFGANWRIGLMAALSLAWLRHVQGDTLAADAMLADADRLAARRPDPAYHVGKRFPESVFLARLAALRARIALARGDHATVATWLAGADAGSSLEVDLMLARAQAALGPPRLAVTLLDAQHAAAQRAGRMGDLIAIEVLQALVAQAAGQAERGALLRAHAQALAAAEGYVRVLLDEELAADPSTGRSPLTRRERELVAMLASGLSNQEIADRLIMTVGTVKWYLHHLYGKLAVRGRLAAIARGRELGLIA